HAGLRSASIGSDAPGRRTPPTSVQMGVYVLLEGAAGELNEKQTEVLSACRDDCERLDKLMRDLLDLSRIEAGESQPKLETVDLRALIAKEADELRPQVEAKNLSFCVSVSNNLPQVTPHPSHLSPPLPNLLP